MLASIKFHRICIYPSSLKFTLLYQSRIWMELRVRRKFYIPVIIPLPEGSMLWCPLEVPCIPFVYRENIASRTCAFNFAPRKSSLNKVVLCYSIFELVARAADIWNALASRVHIPENISRFPSERKAPTCVRYVTKLFRANFNLHGDEILLLYICNNIVILKPCYIY